MNVSVLNQSYYLKEYIDLQRRFQDYLSLRYFGYESFLFYEYEGKTLFRIDLQYVSEIDDCTFVFCGRIQYIKLYEI